MEQLVASGFASTATVIGALNVDESEKIKLCDTILMEHARALAKEGPPGTPAGQAACDKVKSEAQTPAAERDSSPIIATISGVSFLAPRGKFDVEFRQSSLSFIDKSGSLAATCPITNILAVFDMALPAGAQKIKTFCVAAGLKETITFGKSQLKVIALQVKETENLKVDVKGQVSNGKTLEGVQETGMGFGVLSGSTHQVVADLIAYIVGKNVEKHKPETFLSVSRDGAVKCNIKSVHDGFLFFHKVGLLFVNKFVFIPKSEVKSVDFTGTTGRTFDLQVQTKGGEQHDFSMIAKEEHQRVAEYVQLMKFKNAQQAAAGSSAEMEEEEDGKSVAQGGAAARGATKGSAAASKDVVKKQKQEEEEEEEEDDSDDDDDEDFDAGADSDEESEGYDAIEAMDADAMEDDGDDDDEEDDESEQDEEVEGEEKGKGEGDGEGSGAGTKRPRGGDETEDDEEGVGSSGTSQKKAKGCE